LRYNIKRRADALANLPARARWYLKLGCGHNGNQAGHLEPCFLRVSFLDEGQWRFCMWRIVRVPDKPEDIFKEPPRIDPSTLLVNQPYFRKLRKQMQRELGEVRDGRHRFLADEERLLRLRRWSEYIQAYEHDRPLDCQLGMWELQFFRYHFFGKRCIYLLIKRDDALAHEIRKGVKILYNKPWPGGNTWACYFFYGAIGWLHRVLERPKYPGLNLRMPGNVWYEVTEEGYLIQAWLNTGKVDADFHMPENKCDG